MGSSNPLKKIAKAIVKVVKVIVKVVKFVVKAVVNFVKGVFSGDIASIVMLIAIVFTFGAALGFWAASLGITMTTAVTSTAFTVLGSEYQRQKAEKMKEAAESDLAEQASNEQERMTAELVDANEQHFQSMEENRYSGYVSGQFGIGSFEPISNNFGDDTEEEGNETTSSLSVGSAVAIVGISLLAGVALG